MKNNTNIYDIDGNIIREAGDNHKFSIEELDQKIKYYRAKLDEFEKLESPTENEIKQYNTYGVYYQNLIKYKAAELSKLDKNAFTNYLTSQLPKDSLETKKEDVERILNELNENIKEPSKTQEDMLVERENVETIMDEYVEPIE